MLDTSSLVSFQQQFDDLKNVVRESNRRIVSVDADELFTDYANVFIKSYIVSACSILEAFIQELAMSYVSTVRKNLDDANVPHNLLVWSIKREEKLKASNYSPFDLNITRQNVSDLISGNFFKTVKAFEKLGVNLLSDNEFENYKDFIATTIDKRNQIVHHNDEASDMSMLDVLHIIDQFATYTIVMSRIVATSRHVYRIE